MSDTESRAPTVEGREFTEVRGVHQWLRFFLLFGRVYLHLLDSLLLTHYEHPSVIHPHPPERGVVPETTRVVRNTHHPSRLGSARGEEGPVTAPSRGRLGLPDSRPLSCSLEASRVPARSATGWSGVLVRHRGWVVGPFPGLLFPLLLPLIPPSSPLSTIHVP